MQRVAVIFDNKLRPETTGTYCRRALGKLVQAGEITTVEHFLPTELDHVSQDQFNLFLYIDDGLDWSIPDHLRPAAWWAIDTHLNFERCLQKATQVDFTFAAQRDGTEQLKNAGIKTTLWLPLACDPEIHAQQELPNEYDVSFVGHILPGERQNLLNLLQEKFPNSFIGQEYYEKMAAIYSQSKVVFNRSVLNDVNMRVFEGLCSGSLLITNELSSNGQEELFQDGVHCVAYQNAEELLEKLNYYLEHDDIREQIAQAGRTRVLEAHTYQHRMKTILKECQQLSKATPIPAGPPAKASYYFEFDRPDVLSLVPENAQSVLDIGCGGGRLGASIKQRQKASVWGVEFDPTVANRARNHLDQVFAGDITADKVSFAENQFDCIICADVLEHLREPEKVLKRIRNWLRPDGCLVTSIPNVRNHTVIRSLLAGNWTYESAGLLDEDHVRFFTRREIEILLFQTGFEIQEMKLIPGEGYANWAADGCPAKLEIGPLQLRAASWSEAEEFFAYQYLTRATPVKRAAYGLTSIILVTHNQWAYTKSCIESIRRRTTAPYEIIVVDNGSTDGTREYLSCIPEIQVLKNDTNLGFPRAVNQGLEIASGKQILLLNNDTIVTTGWLHRLLEALRSDPDVGLVGPLTNNISGQQQIPAGYDELSQLDGFAWDLARVQQGQTITTDRLVGFCLLFKSELLDRIGIFDEQFGIGNYEDDDYCRRAIDAGYKLLIAKDAFVHHFGSVTFRGSDVDFNQLLQENQKLFQQKWEGDQSTEDPMNLEEIQEHPRFLFDETESGALLLKPNPIKLSACLIVRDNERTIGPCLEGLAPWVDEIVVVDTGSVDRTPEICKEYGARVYHWDWCDDFSAARNESFKYAQGEWIFWMDSDDTLPPECGQTLRDLVKGDIDPNTMGYVGQVHCPNKNSTDVTVVDHVKLIRNRSDLRFEFRIHEQILPSIRRAGGSVEWSDIYVVHSGSDQSVEGRKRKLERDYRLLELDHRERPHHPFVLFNLGMTYADDQKYETAAQYLKECIEVAEPEESQVRKAYALLTNALSQCGKHAEAWKYCIQGLGLYPSDKELLFRQAMLHHHFGRLHEAEATYLRVLNEPEERHFASIDAGLGGYKSRHNLALVYEDLGDYGRAEEQWRSILEIDPTHKTAWRGLGESLFKAEKTDVLEQVILEMREQEEMEMECCILKSRAFELQRKYQSAIQILQNHLDRDEDNLEVLQELCRISFKHSTCQESIRLLTILSEKAPVDPSVYHNLGTCYFQLKQYDQAISAYQRSLELRPLSPETWHLLGHAFFNSDDSQNAQNAWSEVLNLCPSHAEASRLLDSLFEDTLA